jgi:putative transposase
MGRHLRAAEGGLIYRAPNRANARLTIFADEDDYAAFDRALAGSVARHDVRLVAYKVLPNHFHLILWPGVDGELSRFMKWLTLTHTQCWHGHRHSAGTGTSTRAASSPSRSGDDGHLVTVWRYVERNALRAGMVTRAEDWPRCSLRRLAATAPSGGEAPELSA